LILGVGPIGVAQSSWAQSAALLPTKVPPSATDLALGDPSGRFAEPGYFRQAPAPLDFQYYAAREGRGQAAGTIVGGFLVLPRLDIDNAYNNNVFAKSSHEKADETTVIGPSVSATSLWGTHAASLSASLQQGLFDRFSGEDYTNARVLSEGRYDIDRDNAVSGGVLLQHSHEPRGSPDDTRGSEPTPFDVVQTRADYLSRMGDASAEIELRFESFSYSSVPSPSGPIDTSILDRTAFMPRLRLGYALVPSVTQVFVQTRFRDTAYRRLAAGVDRDSRMFQEVVGIELTPGGPLSGEVFGGFTEQDYVSTQLSSFTTPAFGASIAWTPTLLTTVRAEAGRSVEDAVLSGTSGYRQTAFSATIDHELRRSLLLYASIFWADRDYIAQARHETFTQVSVGMRYAINDFISVGPSISFAERDANFSDTNFDQVVALIRLSGRL
jgi:hypothetical protein